MSRDLLVYVHIPFCTSKCHFCDWVQEIPVADLRLPSASSPRVRYLKALAQQIETVGPQLVEEGYSPKILYWGGGTASILSLEEIDYVMSALRLSFPLDDVEEATIECSPETLTREKLQFFRSLGFRRISIGLQSLDDERLRHIGRSHDSTLGAASVRLASEAGFEGVNIDLISGFPGETLEEFAASLRAALELPADHVSLYPYRPAAGTVLRRFAGRDSVGKIDFREQLESYELGRTFLAEAGLPEYALSHFGRAKCRSDLAYFQLRMDWMGFGSGATSLLRQEFLTMQRGQLHRYIDSPTAFDSVFSASSPKITPRLIYLSLDLGGCGEQLLDRTDGNVSGRYPRAVRGALTALRVGPGRASDPRRERHPHPSRGGSPSVHPAPLRGSSPGGTCRARCGIAHGRILTGAGRPSR